MDPGVSRESLCGRCVRWERRRRKVSSSDNLATAATRSDHTKCAGAERQRAQTSCGRLKCARQRAQTSCGRLRCACVAGNAQRLPRGARLRPKSGHACRRAAEQVVLCGGGRSRSPAAGARRAGVHTEEGGRSRSGFLHPGRLGQKTKRRKIQ